jgi:hypothetical protein
MGDTVEILPHNTTIIHDCVLERNSVDGVTVIEDTKADDGIDGRYMSIETTDGDVVIYDHERPTAWLQSDHALEICQ